MFTYCGKLDVPRNLFFFGAGPPRQHRKAVATRRNTRKLTVYRQAVFLLAWMRDGVPYLILDGTVVECDRLDEKKVSSKGSHVAPWPAKG